MFHGVAHFLRTFEELEEIVRDGHAGMGMDYERVATCPQSSSVPCYASLKLYAVRGLGWCEEVLLRAFEGVSEEYVRVWWKSRALHKGREAREDLSRRQRYYLVESDKLARLDKRLADVLWELGALTTAKAGDDAD